MPHVIVKLYPGRSEDAKKALARRIAQAVVEEAGCSEPAVSVAVEEVPSEDWDQTVYRNDILNAPGTLYKAPGYNPFESKKKAVGADGGLMTGVMEDLIKKYNLAPHPEGGYYRELYRSKLSIRSDRVDDLRASVTHIYFLLGQGQVSRFHRVAHDEIWHHYEGAPLTLHRFDGTSVTSETIGPGQDHFTAVVPGNVWQAAESTGDFSLVGCTVAPGFDFRDFTFLRDFQKEAKLLRSLDPGHDRFL